MRVRGVDELYDEVASSKMRFEAVECCYCLAVVRVGREFEGQFSRELWSGSWEF